MTAARILQPSRSREFLPAAMKFFAELRSMFPGFAASLAVAAADDGIMYGAGNENALPGRKQKIPGEEK